MHISPKDYDTLRRILKEHTGIRLDDDKFQLVEKNLSPLLREEGLSSFSDLVAQLQKRYFGHLHREMIARMTTHETLFFRDPTQFQLFEETVLPDILSRNSGRRELAIWSAACSTGQEPYSIAMLLTERFPRVAGWNLKVIGSDLCHKAIADARNGSYSTFDLRRGLPDWAQAKYFEKASNDHWTLKSTIRRMVDFHEINLIGQWPKLPHFDAIFLRYVLIYFDEETRERIIRNARRLLNPGGYLFFGTSEVPPRLASIKRNDSLERVRIYQTVPTAY